MNATPDLTDAAREAMRAVAEDGTTISALRRQLDEANAAVTRLNATEANWRREAQEARSSEAALQRELNAARAARTLEVRHLERERFIDGFMVARAADIVAWVRSTGAEQLNPPWEQAPISILTRAESAADEWFGAMDRRSA